MTMSSRRWTYSVGEYGHRVRAYERKSGVIYIEYLRDGRRERKSLRTNDRAAAKRRANRLSETLGTAAAEEPERDLTVRRMFSMYARENFGRNKPKVDKADKRRARMWSKVLGGNRLVKDITKADIERFKRQRSSGAINARGERVRKDKREVRTRTVGADIWFLKIVTRWAWHEGYLDRDPLGGVKVNHEKNPRRPVVTQARYEALREVSDQVTVEQRWDGGRPKVRSPLSELIDLAFHTGKRISAILGLREEDLRLEPSEHARYGAVRWPANTDKLGIETTDPLHPVARAAIDRALERERRSALLFPSPKDPNKPVSKDLAATWLRKAEGLAKLPHLDGTTWHGFRRCWVTLRKRYPIVDIAAAGSWSDVRTVEQSYMKADSATKQRVVLME